jgi:hypothetical protein
VSTPQLTRILAITLLVVCAVSLAFIFVIRNCANCDGQNNPRTIRGFCKVTQCGSAIWLGRRQRRLGGAPLRSTTAELIRVM